MTEKLGDILAGTAFPLIRNCKLLSLWAQVVDERVKKNTEAIKITNRTLYISTSSPVWAQELSFLKKEIIEKFNREAGEKAILDIRFKTTEGF